MVIVVVCVHHLLLPLLPPSCQSGVEFGSGDSVGQHQTQVHHRQTLLKLQFHPEPIILRQSQLGRTQTTRQEEKGQADEHTGVPP